MCSYNVYCKLEKKTENSKKFKKVNFNPYIHLFSTILINH